MSMCLYTKKTSPIGLVLHFVLRREGFEGTDLAALAHLERPYSATGILCHGHPVQPKMKKLQSNSLFCI